MEGRTNIPEFDDARETPIDHEAKSPSREPESAQLTEPPVAETLEFSLWPQPCVSRRRASRSFRRPFPMMRNPRHGGKSHAFPSGKSGRPLIWP